MYCNNQKGFEQFASTMIKNWNAQICTAREINAPVETVVHDDRDNYKNGIVQ